MAHQETSINGQKPSETTPGLGKISVGMHHPPGKLLFLC